MRLSAAMTGSLNAALTTHLLREDRQEDLCFATWKPSSGRGRLTAVVDRALAPGPRERHVHGNASFEPEYMLRATKEAARAGVGVALMHSHPMGRGWQGLSRADHVAESGISNAVRELTGLPLLGLTLSGDRAWSARFWEGKGRAAAPSSCETVRVIGESLSITFDDALLPVPEVSESQVRTVHTWGEEVQARIARLRIAVAGVGSVGMAVADALARTGVECIGVFDFDSVELVNLDRLGGARPLDAYLRRPKVHVARRQLTQSTTASRPRHEFHEWSICEPEGFDRLLDFDLVFSCVDRPWPRHILNTIAYGDMIPVVEGGLRVSRQADGSLRNAYWRSAVVRPGRACLACLGQYDPADVQVERDGSLDDPHYIDALPADSPLRSRENVAALTVSVAAALLGQFVMYVARPSGFGDPGPLRFNLRNPTVVEEEREACRDGCSYHLRTACGDTRRNATAAHIAAERARLERATAPIGVRLARRADDVLQRLSQRLESAMSPA